MMNWEDRLKGALTDLPAADAQYHKKCYNDFMAIPQYTDLNPQTNLCDGDPMKLVIDDMLANKLLRTWTSLELYEMYLGLGGQLSRQQMLTNLTTHLGDDIVVVHMEGCVSVVGFRELVGKSLKLVKDKSVDEESISYVIRQVRSEARAVQHSNATYDLGDFTYNNTIQQTSATLLKLVAELVSNGEVTKKSLSLIGGSHEILMFSITIIELFSFIWPGEWSLKQFKF